MLKFTKDEVKKYEIAVQLQSILQSEADALFATRIGMILSDRGINPSETRGRFAYDDKGNLLFVDDIEGEQKPDIEIVAA